MKISIFTGAALLGALAVAHAAPTTLTASADTSVRGGSYSARNFGGLDILRVRNTSTLEHARKTYIRFDLSTLPTAVKSAKSATLTLTIAPAEGTSPVDQVWNFKVYGLKDTRNEDWKETSASWENAPANKVESGFELSEDATELGSFSIAGKGEVGKKVTVSSPALLKWFQGDSDGKATFIIVRTEESKDATDNVVHVFASKENTKIPQSAPALSVDF